jgi:hypothetical protein
LAHNLSTLKSTDFHHFAMITKAESSPKSSD